jgi:hypothetical protein
MEQIALTQGDAEKAPVQSVLLLTDGHANQGLVSKLHIVQAMKNMQEKGLGALHEMSFEMVLAVPVVCHQSNKGSLCAGISTDEYATGGYDTTKGCE